MRPDLDTSRGVCFTIILGHVLYIQKVGARNVYCKKSGQKMYIAKSLGQKMYNPLMVRKSKAKSMWGLKLKTQIEGARKIDSFSMKE